MKRSNVQIENLGTKLRSVTSTSKGKRFAQPQRDVERRPPAVLASRPLELKLDDCIIQESWVREGITMLFRLRGVRLRFYERKHCSSIITAETRTTERPRASRKTFFIEMEGELDLAVRPRFGAAFDGLG